MVSRDCFFIAVDGALVCWDFKNHRQYQLSLEYANKLVSVIYGQNCAVVNDAVLEELKRNKVVLELPVDERQWGWGVLSRIFHLGTKDVVLECQPASADEWAAQYLEHCNDVLDVDSPAEAVRVRGEGIKLPPCNTADEFDEVLGRRATVRDFHRLSISKVDLGRILHQTLGFVEKRALCSELGGVEQFSKRRSSPSAGGLNATEGYVYAANVEGIEPGLYYYDPHRHQLHWRNQLVPALGDLLSGQHFANDILVGLFLTSRFDKLWWKYEHSRAYRMALVEIGHVAQTFQLAATACGMSTWLTGALNENSIEALLDLENPNEQILFFVGCGYSDGSVIPSCLKPLLD